MALVGGSDYETYLTVSADGSVVIHENGSGSLTRFTPKTAVDAQGAAKRIVEVMRKKTPMSKNIADNFIKKLKNDADLRQAYAQKFNVSAKLLPGTALYSNVRGIQTLYKEKEGFKRVYNSGKKEYYNKKGKLTRIEHKSGYTITLSYNKAGHVASIKDSQAKQLFFDWYPEGRVKNVWSSGDKKTLYKYRDKDMAEANDIAGNIYKYTYDNNHNLTQITYESGEKMIIKYHPKTNFVSEVVQKNGDSTKYDYGSDPKNSDLHYWTTVTKKGITGKPISNKYEYEMKTRPDGSQYTYRIVTVVNGLKTETIYTECCSLPQKIKRGKHITSFEYNKKGLLTKKTSTRGDYIQLEYHKKFNKITRVVNQDGWTNFKYSKQGNLSKAQNSRGQSVLLIYDHKGRITKMIDKNDKTKKKRSLSFKYNALGKPVEIAMEKVGKINVSYDNYGEIKKVESKAGHKMALQVTQAFQSLLSIVKPAGVNLNM